ncbi:sigma E protease regulator RseP [Shewanella cyperi]|uniref:Zinc metalloprotease n=1 Tax=Shewanella cyperi TaxID=2814292 RepID=A0A974XMJ3_9GAMM|nr:sigma E protease regulator RseP [Shewanella cyperi]QSX31079.1 sigma E protease regulator RseP [Shewanella cyperi]
MYDFLWNLASFVVALGVLITAHEFGHFYVARRCGVKVERFSIGFGPAMWRHIGKDGTEYVLAAVPLGGYVKMLDERVDEVPASQRHLAFNQKSVWARIAIVAAGPVANFLFAIVALYFMFLIGVPSVRPVIDSTIAGKAAESIKIREPMEIIAVSGQTVRNWEEVNLALVSHIGDDNLQLTLAPLARLQGDETGNRDYRLDTRTWKFDPDKESPVTALGLGVMRPGILPTVAQVGKDSAAEAAGLRVGDELIAINGENYSSWQNFVLQVQSSPGKTVELIVKRQGEQKRLMVTPKAEKDADGNTIGLIGVMPESAPWPETMRIQLEYGIVDALGAAVDKTWQLIVVSFKMVGKLFSGDVSVKNLSGPISIAQGAGSSATYGLVYFLGFLALISVNLGIINLLPLPVLDGGHLLYFLVEVFTRKPVPERVQEIGFRFGAALLLMLMSIALFNDFARL